MTPEKRTIHAYAGFRPLDKLEPWTYESRALGKDDVEIKISHCGICGSDLHTLDSGWGHTNYPCVAGHEIIGEITAVGNDVTEHKIGDRVGVGAQVFACLNKDPSFKCTECEIGCDSYCMKKVFTYGSKYADGSQAQGGYADYIRVLGHYAFAIPENIPSDLAAPLLCAGVTVFSPLKHHKVSSGDRIGVVGIGGLGHLALQYIKALGAIPIAFSHSPNKEEEARRLGAEEFVNIGDEVQATRAQRSVNMLLVTANANDLPYDRFLQFIKPRGTYVILGLPEDKIKFSGGSLVGPGIKMAGSLIGSIEDIKDMLLLASEKNIRPVIQKLPMNKVNEGIDLVRTGKVRYRVVLEN